MDQFMQAAIEQAQKSLQEGGIPIGSVLVREGEIISRGHNKRVQQKNPILHGEMDCLNNAGRIGSYKNTIIYSTLMPCYMCAGTIVQFNIPQVIVGESRTFAGAREFMESHGVKVDARGRHDLDGSSSGPLSSAYGDQSVRHAGV